MTSSAALLATLYRPRKLIAGGLAAAHDVLVESVRRHRWFVAITLVYWAACQGAGWLSGGSAAIDIKFHTFVFSFLLGSLALLLVLGVVAYVSLWVRPEGSLFVAIADVLFRRLLTADRFANLLVPLAIGPLFFTTFGSFKRLIPVINPYGWDETFMRVDQALHGGWHPWELIQPLVGSPLATSAINFAYNLWLPLMFLTFIWQSWSLRRPALRQQYLISFLLFWIAIGTVLATLLSSAGPCYYGRVTGLEDPYAPLMAYLYAADGQASVWSLKVQEMLWRNYVDGGTLLGSGISAMPSMHVAIAVLMALMAMRIHRWLGAAYWVFAAVIVVGSVHLGWHYAVDAYVSALAGIAIWFGVGKILRARETSAGRQPALLEGTSGR